MTAQGNGSDPDLKTSGFLLPVLHFFVFSSIYIACCAIAMIAQTNDLLFLQYDTLPYFAFVFFSTLCSYNFHWGLTPFSETDLVRLSWTNRNRKLHILLFLVGLGGALWFFTALTDHWPWLCIGALLTFLYSAPKVPFLRALKKIAVGKTLFLSLVWMYVTTALPILIADRTWGAQEWLFCCSRFCLIYAICILFDYRDRDFDRKEGIRSMITFLGDKGVRTLYSITLVLFFGVSLALAFTGFSTFTVLLLLIPGIVMVPLYSIACKNFSDYLYYIGLDGMMMLSSILTLIF